jgi:Ribbon-helix-helix protein, copG family
MTTEIAERFQSLDNAQALTLANYPGVYFLCQGATIVYVGRAKNIARRLMGHLGRRDFDGVMVMRVPKERLASVEMHWIRRLQPRLNKLLYPQNDGVRPGPGRPATGRLRVLLKLTPETDKLLHRAAGKEGITKSEFVERAIQERLTRLNSPKKI